MDQPISFTAITNQVLKEIEQEKELSDEVLKKLFVLFPNVIEGTLEIIQKNYVIRVTAQPSQRQLFIVRSSLYGRKSGVSDYTCMGNKFCSCHSFLFSVVNKRESIYCKHLLAIQIAKALNKFGEMTIHDSEYTNYITSV